MDWVKQYGVLVAVGVVGVGILLYGLWGQIMPESATVEIVKSTNVPLNQYTNGEQEGWVVVDIAGAVQQPGVYKLPGGSRIGDALVAAGGLSGEADREWVAQTINLAQEIKDGGKIYIPAKVEKTNIPINQYTNESTQSLGKVNINTASAGELDSLVGIGAARSQAIMANRPYTNTEELVSRAKIPQSVYEKIKDSISVY